VNQDQALRLASGFGGGMRIGGACGAATGAVLALSLRYGGDGSAGSREMIAAAVERFYARFVDEVGATDCPAILGCDFRTEQGKAVMEEQGLRESICLEAVRAAASILAEMLDLDSL